MADRTEMTSTSDGVMETFITYPDGPGPYPVIIQLMDGLGMREELRSHARRTASWGYYVVAPDLYYRFGIDGPLDFSDDEQRLKIMAAIGQLSTDRVTDDIDAALRVVGADPAALDGKIGLYGFCMGGRLTLELAQTLGERVAAGASIHPGELVTEASTSPHRHLDRISAELYFGIADRDPHATPEQIAVLREELLAHRISFDLDWLEGALHGYMMPSRPEVYNQRAAEKVWSKLEALFARCLTS